jgi:hypothetical protein
MNEKENMEHKLLESLGSIREELGILSLTLLFVNGKLTYQRYRQAVQEAGKQRSGQVIPNYLGKFM